MSLLRRTYLKSTAILLLGLSIFVAAFACTGIQLKATDGTYINGRTVEFGIPINGMVLIIPRHYAFSGTLPDGKSGLKYNAKYAVVGASMDGGSTVSDGLNEAGLSVGTFYFPDYANYAEVSSKNKDHALAPLEFSNWLLTQFATVAEVKQGLSHVAIVATPFKTWGFVPPFHYVVYDKNGNSIVIEPLNGKLVVYDDPLGVITNSPTFDWQITNLRNYINLSPINVPKVTINGMALQQFGQGAGLHGLPGDFTPPSRFVRAAIFSSTALPEANGQQTVLQVFHILNQFDIPKGAVRSIGSDNQVSADSTMYTLVKDPETLSYYFKTYDNQDIGVVHLQAFDLNAKTLKQININGPQTVTDLSSMAH